MNHVFWGTYLFYVILVLIIAVICFLGGFFFSEFLKAKQLASAFKGVRDVYNYCVKDNKKHHLSVGKYLQQFGDQKIAIYGAGFGFDELYKQCKKYSIHFDCVADRNHDKNEINGIPLVSPAELVNRKPDIVIISSLYYMHEMREFAERNLPDSKIITYLELIYRLKNIGKENSKAVAISSWNGSICLNYGCALQAFALQHQIRDLGYQPFSLQTEMRNGSIVSLLGSLKLGIQYYKTKYAFSKFQKANMVIGNEKKAELYPNEIIKRRCEILVSGSDTIWSQFHVLPSHIWSYPALSFLPKFSYAASSGLSPIMGAYFLKNLSSFNALGIRERMVEEQIKKTTNDENLLERKMTVTLDPTLLLEPSVWEKIAEKHRFQINKDREGYVLCYLLEGPGNLAGIEHKIKEHYQAQKVIFIDTSIIDKLKYGNKPDFDFKGQTLKKDIGPGEFLYLFQNAKAVLTDSYHGVMFAIVFRKQMYVQTRVRGNMEDPRMLEVFEKLSLGNRYHEAYDSIENMPSIDYEEVEKKLVKERKRSLRFLKDALTVCEGAEL